MTDENPLPGLAEADLNPHAPAVINEVTTFVVVQRQAWESLTRGVAQSWPPRYELNIPPAEQRP